MIFHSFLMNRPMRFTHDVVWSQRPPWENLQFAIAHGSTQLGLAGDILHVQQFRDLTELLSLARNQSLRLRNLHSRPRIARFRQSCRGDAVPEIVMSILTALPCAASATLRSRPARGLHGGRRGVRCGVAARRGRTERQRAGLASSVRFQDELVVALPADT